MPLDPTIQRSLLRKHFLDSRKVRIHTHCYLCDVPVWTWDAHPLPNRPSQSHQSLRYRATLHGLRLSKTADLHNRSERYGLEDTRRCPSAIRHHCRMDVFELAGVPQQSCLQLAELHVPSLGALLVSVFRPMDTGQVLLGSFVLIHSCLVLLHPQMGPLLSA